MNTSGVVLAFKPNDVKPGWIALFLVLGLCVATVALWRSMDHQLRKIKAPHQADLARLRRDDGAQEVPAQRLEDADRPDTPAKETPRRQSPPEGPGGSAGQGRHPTRD